MMRRILFGWLLLALLGGCMLHPGAREGGVGEVCHAGHHHHNPRHHRMHELDGD